MASNGNFHNTTSSLNDLWYTSHRAVISAVLVKLGEQDKMEEFCSSILGPKIKIKEMKDPNKPKRAKSSYLYFCDKMRPIVTEKLKKANGKNWKVKISKVSEKLGKLWSEISDKDKEPYIKLSQKDSERYKTEMENYTQ